MPVRGRFLLFRVDDRLLHGQVTLGWGLRLGPERYLLVDDALASDPVGTALYVAAAPEGTTVVVRSVAAALRNPDPEELRARTLLLVRDLPTAAALLRNGWPGPVNLGGIHAHPGAEPVLPFLYLTPGERALLLELANEGHELEARDLPEAPARDVRSLLGSDPP